MVRRATLALLAASALALAGCGSSGSPAASRPEPPAPIVLSAYVTAGAVRVAPSALGAGPVLLTVANQSARAIELSVVRGSGRVIARTAPINPDGVTQIKLGLPSGSYSVRAVDSGARDDAARATAAAAALTAPLHVGAPRAGSGDQVLQP